MADVEETAPTGGGTLNVIEKLEDYPGTTVEEKTEAVLKQHPVLLISKTWCPFCLDVKNLLTEVLGCQTAVIEVNTVSISLLFLGLAVGKCI
jgi:hypothetical protein